jgi:hypothetical protein
MQKQYFQGTRFYAILMADVIYSGPRLYSPPSINVTPISVNPR